jgi:hypothetical protein
LHHAVGVADPELAIADLGHPRGLRDRVDDTVEVVIVTTTRRGPGDEVDLVLSATETSVWPLAKPSRRSS